MLSWVREKIAEGRLRWQQTSQQQSPPPLPPPDFASPSTSPTMNSLTLDVSFASSTQQNAIGNILHQQDQQQQQLVINQNIPQLPNAIRRRSIANLSLQLKEHPFNNKNDALNSQKCYSTIANKLEQREHMPFSSQYDKTWSSNGSFTETSTSLIVNRRSNELTVPYVNLRILSIIGYKCSVCVPITLTGIDVKQKAIAEFQTKHQLEQSIFYGHHDERNDCDNLDLIQLSRLYKLTRISKLHDDYDERLSLSRANIQNNEEMLLVRCSHETSTSGTSATLTSLVNTAKDLQTTDFDSDIDHNDNDEYSGNIVVTNIMPTQLDIDLVTSNVCPRNISGPNVVNIDELVLQSDVQYDIRKILISLSNACAYVIGSGPFAPKIITMLKQRLIQRKRHENDTQECLIAMGFSRPKAQHALHINNNVYAAALEWLIENQSPTNLLSNEDQSPAMSLSGKFTNNVTAKDNIESLLEIIRIYCQRELPAPPEMVQMIVEMGFDEASAREALKITKNHQSYACEWLVGNRSKIGQFEQIDGLSSDSPILAALLNSPQVQLSLSNPKIFIAYLSILEDYASMSIWLNDHETSSVIGQVLRTYHEQKHILAINQFSQQNQK